MSIIGAIALSVFTRVIIKIARQTVVEHSETLHTTNARIQMFPISLASSGRFHMLTSLEKPGGLVRHVVQTSITETPANRGASLCIEYAQPCGYPILTG